MWRLNPQHGAVYACAWAAPDRVNRCPVLPADLDPWTLAPPTPPVAPWGEATRGHNAVTALVHATAQSCDCTAETEVPGLIPGTDLRPTDVLTSALCNYYTALDISICSPHAQQAGPDCTQTRREAKLAYHGPHFPSLFRQNTFLHPDRLERLRATSPRDVDRFALSQ